MTTISADYLVKGAGASAMAFVDTMLRESDATFVIVDRRHAPGGHWNDAYPFVRLHQPSMCYGVASRELGTGRRDETGFNKGLYELASGVEVTDYFHRVMRDTFLPSGRVQYFPVSEVVSDQEFVSLLSGERARVEVKKKLVDAALLQTSIPLTHKRKFAIADGVTCVPPNDLTRLAPQYRKICVLGAGKTAIDSVLWLVANGAAPESITWVLPRDPWLWNRRLSQFSDALFEDSIGGVARQYEICASATSVRDLCERSAAAKIWFRLDDGVWPTMFHAATVTQLELEALQAIPNKIRKGRVRRIEPDRIVLDGGDVVASPDTVYVDCTARALASNVGDQTPVFSPGRIALQMVRLYQPTFSAAMIAHIEASGLSEEEKAKLARPTPMTDTVEDWVSSQAASLMNQAAWTSRDGFAPWMANCRLDMALKVAMRVQPGDTAKMATLGKLRTLQRPAVENLLKLAAQAKAA